MSGARRSSRVPSLAPFFLLCIGCAQAPAYAPRPLAQPHSQGTQPTSGDPVQAELPAHRFAVPPHEPRQRVSVARADLRSLPPLKTSSRCFHAGAVAEASVRTRPGSAPMGGQPAATPRPSAPKKRSKAKDEKRVEKKVDSASDSNAHGGGDAAVEAVAAEPEPPQTASDMDDAAQSPPTDSSPELAVDRKELSRASSRARRRSKRSRRRIGKNRGDAPATESAPLAQERPAEPPPRQVIPAEVPPRAEGWGEALYVSNDDSMSLSSAQRVQFAIANVLPLQPSDVRAHEILNWAFGDMEANVPRDFDFAVEGDLHPIDDDGRYALALAVHGRRLSIEQRRNAALTLLVDVSGSMKREDRIERVRRGMLRMVRELKQGDVVNLVAFDHRVCPKVEGFVVGRDDLGTLTDAIHSLKPKGSTNLEAGLRQAYEVADRSYQPAHSNRVLVFTDARANQGETNPRVLSMVTDHFDARRIRLSGIGVGQDFNDHLLDELTEKGRGAYVFLGNDDVVERIFGRRFISLIETTANDVHFRLHLPPSMRVERFRGEQASTRKSDVQAVHFFANTSQILLSEVDTWQQTLREQDDVMLEIEYLDPESGEQRTEFHPIHLSDAAHSRRGLAANAQLVVLLADMLKNAASLGEPRGWKARPGGWNDPRGALMCDDGQESFRAFEDASWHGSALRVWEDYCRRYARRDRRPSRKR